jgi:hypothetical protein
MGLNPGFFAADGWGQELGIAACPDDPGVSGQVLSLTSQ